MHKRQQQQETNITIKAIMAATNMTNLATWKKNIKTMAPIVSINKKIICILVQTIILNFL